MGWLSRWNKSKRLSLDPLRRNNPSKSLIQDVPYDLINRLVIFLDEDPSENESWSQFLIRHTGGSDELSVNSFIELKKTQKWDAYRHHQAERKRIREELLRGSIPKYDNTIISQEEFNEIKHQIRDALSAREKENVREQLRNKQNLKYSKELITPEELSALVEEVRQEKRAFELEKVRTQLEKGEKPVFNKDLVSLYEVFNIAREVESTAYQWLLNRVMPKPQPYGVSNYGAESLVADWLVYLGLNDVEVTVASGDGGVDVVSERHVCQVKNYKNQSVSVQEVREIFGVAVSQGKKPLIFTSSNLTVAAGDFAEQNGVGVVHYDAMSAELFALNSWGGHLLHEGKYGL